MPKKRFTQEDIDRTIAKAKANRKKGAFDFGSLQKRIHKRSKLWANKKAGVKNNNNADLKVGLNNSIIVSNDDKIETSIFLEDKREYYENNSFKDTFDTEVVQLLTKAPPEPIADVAITPPPPAPEKIAINCHGNLWTMDGKKGRVYKDKPSWHKNRHPLGNNPGGGYLFTPNDHGCFYLEICSPSRGRNTYNYEWKVDGELVSTKPFFQMYNMSNGGKVSEGRKGTDSAWLTGWRDQDDVIISVRVWNESGEKTASVPIRCAMDVGLNDRLDADRRPIPRWQYKGYRTLNDENWLNKKNPILTDYIKDPKYRPRTVQIVDVNFAGYNTNPRLRPMKFKAKPGTRLQRIEGETYPLAKVVKQHANLDYGIGGIWKKHLTKVNKKLSKVMANDKKKKVKAFISKFGKTVYNRIKPFDQENYSTALIGEVYYNKKWTKINEFWSGVKGVKDPYDITNFMKKGKDGNHSSGGRSLAESLDHMIEFECSPGEEKTWGLRYGFGYSIKGVKKTYWMYTKMSKVTVDKEDGDNVRRWANISPYVLEFHGAADPPKPKAAKEKWTKSRAKNKMQAIQRIGKRQFGGLY